MLCCSWWRESCVSPAVGAAVPPACSCSTALLGMSAGVGILLDDELDLIFLWRSGTGTRVVAVPFILYLVRFSSGVLALPLVSALPNLVLVLVRVPYCTARVPQSLQYRLLGCRSSSAGRHDHMVGIANSRVGFSWVFPQITSWDFLHPELFPILQIIDGRVF